MKEAYFLSHNGLGDNITNIGAVRFLLQYYDTIYFLCKDIYQENVRLLFQDKRVVIVPFNAHDEFNDCKRIFSNVNENIDRFISGMHKNYLKSKITHPELLSYKKNKEFTIKYRHIANFYNDIGLDLSVYVHCFDILSNDISRKYYDDIKQYKIVFLHTKGSNRNIHLNHIVELYHNNDEYILICPNQNMYDVHHPKYTIANIYCQNIPVAYFIDIIKHTHIFHVIDSCFSCIINPLRLAKKINPVECTIYDVFQY